MEKSLFRAGSFQAPTNKPSAAALLSVADDHDVSFAESFSTISRRLAPKKLDDITESEEAVKEDQSNKNGEPPEKKSESLPEIADKMIQLRDKPTSSMTVEKLAKKFFNGYNSDSASRNEVLLHLALNHNVDTDSVKVKASELARAEEPEAWARLQSQLKHLLNPPYNWLFSQMAHLEDGVKFLSDVRADMLAMLSANKSLDSDKR